MSTNKKTMLKEIMHGMNQTPKALPSKYFYDEAGSRLFDEITELEEYYPTRTERLILEENVDSISSELGEKVLLIEPGSGSSEKTKILLSRMDSICCYIPIDISGDYLGQVAEGLREEFPEIDIQPLAADYTHPFELPNIYSSSRKVVFFPGSTIGNFKKETVVRFFEVIADILGEDGAMLIGVDLKKDVKVLEDAYNDAREVTAAFNKNMLRHLNREIGTDFDLDSFDHKAIWNAEAGRIEMRLYANKEHRVKVNGDSFVLEEGEFIHTENSHKYSLEEFENLVSPWFKVKKVWTDENDLFSVQYLEPV